MADRRLALLDAARQARENAYAPYSGFKVGAALLDNEGHIHVGANIENAAYPLGICAEAAAVAAMVATGGRGIAEVLVVAEGAQTVTPCGGCRQVLAEFGRPDMPVYLADPRGVREILTLGTLLPRTFSAKSP